MRESAETTRKTIPRLTRIAGALELERALAGLPREARQMRISTAGELIKAYLEHYPINHRPKSVTFAQGAWLR